MQQTYDASCMCYFIGDVRDGERMNKAMNEVDFFIHTVAMKQVPATEYNPIKAKRTKSIGSKTKKEDHPHQT